MRCLFALAAVALAVPAAAGTITGKVDLVDKPGRRTTDLTDVVVYLDDVKVKPKPATASVVMKGKAFSPHVVAIPVGGTVEFPNEDPIFHNAFSVSGAEPVRPRALQAAEDGQPDLPASRAW